MKKITYLILALIIIVGTIITLTIGLKADIIYSKNVEIDIYVGEIVKVDEIKEIAKEVFPEEKMIIQEIELFGDMVSIIMPDKSDEELQDKLEELNNKINEKYETENKVEESIWVTHNPKIKLSSILKPYILPIIISTVIILVYSIIRYKKLGITKVIINYVLYIGAVEAVFLSIIAITRFPINRLIIPIGLVLYATTVTVLAFINEKKLIKTRQVDNKKNK